jgi:hypothetical protein
MPSPAGGAEVTDLTVKRVRAAVENELAEKGYSPDARNPDFLIAIRGGKEKRVDVVDGGYAYRGYDHDNYGYYHPHHRIDVYQYEEGTLILDFVDAGSRELIWRGTVTRVIDPNATRKKRVQMVNEAVGKVLETFPPPE